MEILSWILIELIAGALAKWLMPGSDPGSVMIAILLGIGAGFIGLFQQSHAGFSSRRGTALAVQASQAQALIVLGAANSGRRVINQKIQL